MIGIMSHISTNHSSISNTSAHLVLIPITEQTHHMEGGKIQTTATHIKPGKMSEVTPNQDQHIKINSQAINRAAEGRVKTHGHRGAETPSLFVNSAMSDTCGDSTLTPHAGNAPLGDMRDQHVHRVFKEGSSKPSDPPRMYTECVNKHFPFRSDTEC